MKMHRSMKNTHKSESATNSIVPEGFSGQFTSRPKLDTVSESRLASTPTAKAISIDHSTTNDRPKSEPCHEPLSDDDFANLLNLDMSTFDFPDFGNFESRTEGKRPLTTSVIDPDWMMKYTVADHQAYLASFNPSSICPIAYARCDPSSVGPVAYAQYDPRSVGPGRHTRFDPPSIAPGRHTSYDPPACKWEVAGDVLSPFQHSETWSVYTRSRKAKHRYHEEEFYLDLGPSALSSG